MEKAKVGSPVGLVGSLRAVLNLTRSTEGMATEGLNTSKVDEVGLFTTYFVTEKGGLVPERNLWQRMRNLDELGFPAGPDLHSFRRAYATNLQVEYGDDVSFVQLHFGHEHASSLRHRV